MAGAHRRFLGKPMVTSKASAYSPSSAGLENWGGVGGGEEGHGLLFMSGTGVGRLFIKDQRVNSLVWEPPDLCHNCSSLPL